MVLAADAAHSDNNAVLILAALLGIATVVVSITWLKVHPFLALILGSAMLGLVKENFGLSVGQTIKTWSVMETIISVVGLVCVLLLNLVL